MKSFFALTVILLLLLSTSSTPVLSMIAYQGKATMPTPLVGPSLSESPESQRFDHAGSSRSPHHGQTLLAATVDVRRLLSASGPPPVVAVPPISVAQTNSGLPTISGRAAGPFISGTVNPSSVSIVSGFDGLNQIQSCQCVPPDPILATGPNHVFEMVNSKGEIFTKQGTPVQSFLLASFFHLTNGNVSDPRVLFDASSGRWFASIIASPNAYFRSGNITMAVSTSSDPFVWNIYVIPLALESILPDQPILGLSDDKFVVSANAYDGIFLGAEYWVLNKSEMVAGVARIDTTSYGPDATLESMHPVQSLSSTASLYLVSTGGGDVGPFIAPTTVKLVSITGVPPGDLSLQFYSLPISAVNPPNGRNDVRVKDAAWFQGKLWFTADGKCIPSGDTTIRGCIRLTEIDTTVPAVIQDFDFCTVGANCFYGALRIDSQGSLAVVYGFFGSNGYYSVAVTGQTVSDPFNTLRQPQTLVAGTAIDTSGRYGDYFGASLDPSDQTLVWVNGEYHNNSTGTCYLSGGGSTGNCWSTFIGSIRISANDISILNAPTLITLAAGTAGTSTITFTVTSQNFFTGTIDFSTLVSPSGPTVSLNTTSATLFNPGDSVGVKLILSTTSSTLSGSYTVTLTGTTPSSSIPANIPVDLVGFTFSSSQNTISLSTASSSTSKVTVTSLYGFNGTVTLASSISAAGPTISLSPNSIPLNTGQTATSTLTITTSTSTTTGLYKVTVTATSGTQSRNNFIMIFVTPTTFNVNNVQNFTGETIKTVETLYVDSPSTTFSLSGTASVVATNSSTNALIFSNNYTITQFPIIGQGGTYTTALIYNTTAVPYAISSETLIRFFTSSPPSTTVSVFPERNPDINENGLVDPADSNTVNSAYGCQAGMPCYNPKADINADGQIGFFDSSIVLAVQGFPNINPSYSVSANPSSIAISPNSPSTISISLKSLAGFAGTVSLAASATPIGLTSSLSPSSVTVPNGGTATATLTVSSPNLSFYTVNVTATSGIMSRFVLIPVQVESIRVTQYPNDIYLNAGQSTTLQRTVYSVFDFQGTVNVTATIVIAPQGSQGNQPTIFFSPPTVFVPFENGTNTVLNVQTTANTVGGAYFLRISGTSGLVSSYPMTIQLTVENFALSAKPGQVTQRVGVQGSSLINITMYNYFQGTISLNVSTYPAGINCSLNATTITLSLSSPTGKSLLTCSSSTSNVYTVTVTGTGSTGIGSGLSHSVAVTYTIQDLSLSASPTLLTIQHGSSGQSVITVSSLNGFSGNVNLTATISPVLSRGPTVSLSPTTLTLASGGQGTSIITVSTNNNTPKGTYTVTVTATSGSIVHTTSVTVTIK